MTVDYEWRLRLLMAEHGMFKASDLQPRLAEHGIALSDSQVWRLVTGRPERLNLRVLVVLCEILDCEPGDLDPPHHVRRPAPAAAIPSRRPAARQRPRAAHGPLAPPGAMTTAPTPVGACGVCGRTSRSDPRRRRRTARAGSLLLLLAGRGVLRLRPLRALPRRAHGAAAAVERCSAWSASCRAWIAASTAWLRLRLADGPACSGCAHRRLTARASCSVCGQWRRPAARGGGWRAGLRGRPGVFEFGVLARRLRRRGPLRRGLCPAGQLHDRVDQLRRSSAPERAHQLRRYWMRWPVSQPGVDPALDAQHRCLRRPALAAADVVDQHAGLDELVSARREPRAVALLRAALVDTACWRHATSLGGLERWLRPHSQSCPTAPTAATSARFTWHVGDRSRAAPSAGAPARARASTRAPQVRQAVIWSLAARPELTLADCARTTRRVAGRRRQHPPRDPGLRAMAGAHDSDRAARGLARPDRDRRTALRDDARLAAGALLGDEISTCRDRFAGARGCSDSR